MRVFGIDCGTECTGYGVVDLDERGRESRLVPVASGGIRLPRKEPLAARLALVHTQLSRLIAAYQPDVVAVEEVFHSINAQSALKLGHVRGVALLAAAGQGLTVVEYAPNTIKSSVVGYGLARKEQVQYMVARLLALPTPPEPADAADALAIAICHLHHAQTARNQGDGSANGDAGEGRAGWSARQRIEVRVAPAPLLQRLPSEQLGLPARKVCL
jgi:crossover junction endodeoxyribonuclease RuvC